VSRDKDHWIGKTWRAYAEAPSAVSNDSPNLHTNEDECAARNVSLCRGRLLYCKLLDTLATLARARPGLHPCTYTSHFPRHDEVVTNKTVSMVSYANYIPLFLSLHLPPVSGTAFYRNKPPSSSAKKNSAKWYTEDKTKRHQPHIIRACCTVKYQVTTANVYLSRRQIWGCFCHLSCRTPMHANRMLKGCFSSSPKEAEKLIYGP
jgi:hypothetical protein